jgi:hypothetical protein
MLQILHLENCREWQTIPSLEMFPFLRKLKVIRMCKLKEIFIPCLEELVLIEMPRLEKMSWYLRDGDELPSKSNADQELPSTE